MKETCQFDNFLQGHCRLSHALSISHVTITRTETEELGKKQDYGQKHIIHLQAEVNSAAAQLTQLITFQRLERKCVSIVSQIRVMGVTDEFSRKESMRCGKNYICSLPGE